MATATVQIDSLDGFAGPARCFQLAPPVTLAGVAYDYVTLWVQSGYGQVTKPEVCLVPATASGAAAPLVADAPPSLMRHPGSFVLHDDAVTADQITGAYAFALLMLGGYTIPAVTAVTAQTPADAAP